MSAGIEQQLQSVSPLLAARYRTTAQGAAELASAAGAAREQSLAAFYAQQATGRGLRAQLKQTVGLAGNATSAALRRLADAGSDFAAALQSLTPGLSLSQAMATYRAAVAQAMAQAKRSLVGIVPGEQVAEAIDALNGASEQLLVMFRVRREI